MTVTVTFHMLPTFLEFETFLSVHVPGWACGLLKGKVDRQREKPHFLLRARGDRLSSLRDSGVYRVTRCDR